jgi:hypothetical protein
MCVATCIICPSGKKVQAYIVIYPRFTAVAALPPVLMLF